jgi:hypothetical protein
MCAQLILIPVVAILASCTHVGQTVPSDNRALLPASGGRVSSDTVFGSHFGPFSSLNDDCSVRSNARARILQKPRNGSARAVTAHGVAAFSANNAFARCNGAPIIGTYVVYAPRPGFVGKDSFRFELVFEDGERRVLTPELNIGPRP